MNLVDRKSARALGLARYFTGKPCLRGHVTERYTKGKHCVQCQSDHEKSWKARDPARNLNMRLAWKTKNLEAHTLACRRKGWKRLNLPEPTRPEPSLCEVCGCLPGKKALNLDHDHVTGKFRGWACLKCNTAIGKLGDDVAGLLKAVAYLERANGV